MYQCTFCDITSDNYNDEKFVTCRQNKHRIIPMLTKEEIKQDVKKETKKSVKKVKGRIGPYYVESILVDLMPHFLCYNKIKDEIILLPEIEYLDVVYRPLEPQECGYFPYAFSKNEVTELTSRQIGREEILDSMKEQINHYLSLDERDKHLVLGDLLLSYCQEWIDTLHFPFFVGETESGKSSALHLFKWLGYRCLYGEDIPNADIYNFLGTDEEATGIIAEDEAQDMAFSREKIRTYKNSYSRGSLKPRIIGADSHNKKQVYYKTFCLKLFAGEKIPEDKGFIERLAIVHMTEGKPLRNIKRLNEEEKTTLNYLRNKILIWKVQNVKKGIERKESGLEKRDQELWEDFLSITFDTKYNSKCRDVVKFYIDQRHNSIWNSIESRIFKILIKTFKENLVISFESFWNILTQNHPDLDGVLEKETFYPNDFAKKITRNYLARLLEDKFQANKQMTYEMEGERKHLVTKYIFNSEVCKSLVEKYNIQISIDSPILSGRGGVSGQLMHEQNNHVDHLDHLKA